MEDMLVTGPVPEGELRVSDSDRDATLQVLSQQAAEGRLTLDELEERASQALGAKTRADLATVTRDLPAGPGPAPAPASRKPPVRWFVAIMGGSRRRGRFRTASQLNSLAIMGGDEIDLRDAEIDGATHSSDEEIRYDAQRDAYLKARGWRVLRISNVDVYADLDAAVPR